MKQLLKGLTGINKSIITAIFLYCLYVIFHHPHLSLTLVFVGVFGAIFFLLMQLLSFGQSELFPMQLWARVSQLVQLVAMGRFYLSAITNATGAKHLIYTLFQDPSADPAVRISFWSLAASTSSLLIFFVVASLIHRNNLRQNLPDARPVYAHPTIVNIANEDDFQDDPYFVPGQVHFKPIGEQPEGGRDYVGTTHAATIYDDEKAAPLSDLEEAEPQPEPHDPNRL